MNITELNDPLTIDQIEFRVQSVMKQGAGVYANILAYKNARCDMEVLDRVVGPMNWKREHLRENKNCIVSIYDANKCEWVGKEDTGTVSMTEKEKGLASDSFKRACFNWGIGRELYDYPFIFIKMNSGEYYEKDGKAKASNSFMRDWKWESKFLDNKLVSLTCKDKSGNSRFSHSIKSKTLPEFTQESFDKWSSSEIEGKPSSAKEMRKFFTVSDDRAEKINNHL